MKKLNIDFKKAGTVIKDTFKINAFDGFIEILKAVYCPHKEYHAVEIVLYKVNVLLFKFY